MRKSTLVVIVFFIWLVSIVAALPAPLFTRLTSGINCKGELQTICFEMWFNVPALKVYTILISVLEFLVPMWIMASIYFSIAMKLWSHRTPPGNVTERHREITYVRKQKTIPMLIALVIAFFLSWAPYHGYNIVFTFFNEDIEMNFEQQYIMLYAVEGIAMLNSVVSTIIYFIMSPVFRKELTGLYGRFFKECPTAKSKLRRAKVVSKSTPSNSSNFTKGTKAKSTNTGDTKI